VHALQMQIGTDSLTITTIVSRDLELLNPKSEKQCRRLG